MSQGTKKIGKAKTAPKKRTAPATSSSSQISDISSDDSSLVTITSRCRLRPRNERGTGRIVKLISEEREPPQKKQRTTRGRQKNTMKSAQPGEFRGVGVEQQKNRNTAILNGSPYQGNLQKNILSKNVGSSDYGINTMSPFVALGDRVPESIPTENVPIQKFQNTYAKGDDDTINIESSEVSMDTHDMISSQMTDYGKAHQTKRTPMTGGSKNVESTVNHVLRTQTQSMRLECITGVELKTFPIEPTTGMHYVVVGPFNSPVTFTELPAPPMTVFADAIKRCRPDVPGPALDVPMSTPTVCDVHVPEALNNISTNDSAGISGDNHLLKQFNSGSGTMNTTEETETEDVYFPAMDGTEDQAQVNDVNDDTAAGIIIKNNSTCGNGDANESGEDRTDSNDNEDNGNEKANNDWDRCAIV